MQTLAYFVSPHGFGHAARASAVMEAVHRRLPETRFEIFTRVPAWFFADSLSRPFGYHDLLTDIGLVQTDSLTEDLPATVARLDEFLPFPADRLDALAHQLNRLNCRLVLCDIAPLGIAAARAAGIPSVLVENFTWDWIYEGYLPSVEAPALAGRLRRHISGLRDWFQQADYHIQAEPVCSAAAHACLTVPPVSRPVRTPRTEIRQRLDIPAGVPAVLVTMGGTAWAYDFLAGLARLPEVCFVIPGVDGNPPAAANVRLLPRQSGFYHPDLVNAVDVVVGKVGYSTIAEVYQAGVPMGYIARAQFRESPVLVQYIEQRMAGLPIDEASFRTGRWLDRLEALLALPRRTGAAVSGAEQIARFVLSVLGVNPPEAGGQ